MEGAQRIMVLVRLLVQPIHLLTGWAQACGDVAEFRPSQNQMKHSRYLKFEWQNFSRGLDLPGPYLV